MPAMSLRQSSRSYPWRMFEELLGLTVLIWVGFMVVLGALVTAIAIFSDVEISVMSEADGVVAPYVGFIGGYMMYSLLPMYVANGTTRREFARHAAMFAPVFALAVALLMQIGFLLEWALYSAMDWPRDVNSEHLYSSATQLHLVFIEHLLVFLVWCVAGAFVGAMFYRSSQLGSYSIPLGLLAVSAAGIAVRGEWGPLGSVYERVTGGPADLPLVASILIALASAAAAGWLVWLTIRDIPIRSQSQ